MKGPGRKKENANLSTFDRIISYLYYFKNRFFGILKYCEVYHNYFTVALHVVRGKYPVEAILRNGNRTTLSTYTQAHFVALLQGCEGIDYDIASDMVTISSAQHIASKEIKKVTLYGSINNGDVVSIFLNNDYYNMPVQGKTVIDIGANIGDSAIYFALRGASKIIGLEPIPKNYEIAKMNIKSNNLSNKITMLLAGCASENRYITIDPNYISSTDGFIEVHKAIFEPKGSNPSDPKGVKVPLLTLEDILNENNILPGDILLKMDCEGCEYETILNASKDTLQKFSYMQVEYHYGYENIKEKLEKSGFNVSVTRPIIHRRHNQKMFVGWIYAKGVLSNMHSIHEGVYP